VRPIPARPIPTVWAANRAERPELQAAYHVELASSAPQNAQPQPVDAHRRLDSHRIPINPLQRFSSSDIESAPAGSDGWRSAHR
jgi:hypothetical protein